MTDEKKKERGSDEKRMNEANGHVDEGEMFKEMETVEEGVTEDE